MKTRIKLSLVALTLASVLLLTAQINNPVNLSNASGVLPLANIANGLPTGTDTGAVNAYVVANLVPAMTAYAVGQTGCFVVANASTIAAPTVNFNGLGTKTIVKINSLNLANGDMTTGTVSCMVYDGTNFELLNPQSRTGTGVQVLNTSPSFSTLIAFSTSGVHFNTSAASTDISGTIAIASATSAAKTFTTNYTNAPTCVIVPTSDPTAVGVYWVTSSISTVTANIKTSGTITFNYHCISATN